MNPKSFKPQNYFDSSLCEALDRIARENGIVDNLYDPRGIGRRQEPSKEIPWLFLTNSRFDQDRRAAQDDPNDSLSAFLRARPAVDEADAERHRAHLAWVEANHATARAFEDAVEPLIFALRDGLIIAEGFSRSGNRADATVTKIDPRRWSMDWIIRREGRAAVCELFSDLTMQHAEHILTGVGLVAPPQALPVEIKPEREAARAPKRASGRRKIDDSKAIKRILEIMAEGNQKTFRGCVFAMLNENKGAVHKNDAEYERLRRKFNRIGRIVETPEGVTFIPNSTK